MRPMADSGGSVDLVICDYDPSPHRLNEDDRYCKHPRPVGVDTAIAKVKVALGHHPNVNGIGRDASGVLVLLREPMESPFFRVDGVPVTYKVVGEISPLSGRAHG